MRLLLGVLAAMMLVVCSRSPEFTTRPQAMKEIVVYARPDVDLLAKNGRFYSESSVDVDRLNAQLDKYGVEVHMLGSKAGGDRFNRDRSQAIFTITVSDHAEEIRDFLLAQDDYIDAAYIKPEAEDAGME